MKKGFFPFDIYTINVWAADTLALKFKGQEKIEENPFFFLSPKAPFVKRKRTGETKKCPLHICFASCSVYKLSSI